MNDSQNSPIANEPVSSADVDHMLASHGQMLLALVLLHVISRQPTIFDNAGGGPRDEGRRLRGAALDQLSLFLVKR